MKLKAVKLFVNACNAHATVDEIADMLRYDNAFVRAGDPSRVLFVTFAKDGGGRLQPTHGRWRGYASSALTLDVEQPSLDTILCEKELWTTYQHPRTPDGPTDYGALMPVPLAAFIKAKDLPEVRDLPPVTARADSADKTRTDA